MSAPAPQPGLARTIDEVIVHLDDIIARSIREQSRLGYFAALYRKVTVKVKEGIAQGRFEDGPNGTIGCDVRQSLPRSDGSVSARSETNSLPARVVQNGSRVEANHTSGSASGNERAHQL